MLQLPAGDHSLTLPESQLRFFNGVENWAEKFTPAGAGAEQAGMGAASGTAGRVVTFGEAMIRVTPPLNERLESSLYWRPTVGGTELNVAVALPESGDLAQGRIVRQLTGLGHGRRLMQFRFGDAEPVESPPAQRLLVLGSAHDRLDGGLHRGHEARAHVLRQPLRRDERLPGVHLDAG